MFDFRSFYKFIAHQMPSGSVLAEVGIADGVSSIYLAETLINDEEENFKLYMIDSLDYGGPDQLVTVFGHIIKSKMGPHIELLTIDSLNASCRFPDNHFDFVFIDASHKYEWTKADIRCWYPKIKEGGILAGHDYLAHPEVRRAVDEVIPKDIVRAPLPNGQTFKSEKVLQIEETKKGYGVWWIKKKFYVTLN